VAWTDQEYQTLKAAVASGVSSISFGGGPSNRSVTYHGLEQMRALLKEMEQQLFPELHQGRQSRRFVSFSKGFR